MSDLRNITKQHYLEQPKSMLCRLCRKSMRRFHESPSEDFEDKWSPNSAKDL